MELKCADCMGLVSQLGTSEEEIEDATYIIEGTALCSGHAKRAMELIAERRRAQARDPK